MPVRSLLRIKIMPKKLYIIQAEEFIKVGISINPKSRLESLQVACPLKLKLAWTGDIRTGVKDHIAESECHKALREYHVRGEWFRCDFETAHKICCDILGLDHLDLCRVIQKDVSHFKANGRAHGKRVRRMARTAQEADKIAKSRSSYIEITKHNIDLLMTRGAGIKKATIEALGESWPLKHGWKKRIIGKMVDRSIFKL